MLGPESAEICAPHRRRNADTGTGFDYTIDPAPCAPGPQDSPPMHIQLDPLGGIAGDMFIAAVLDARPDLADGTLAAIRAAGLPLEWRISLVDHRDTVLAGKRFNVLDPSADHGHRHSDPDHGHASFRDIARRLGAAPLEPGVSDRTLAMLSALARAEAKVHGIGVDDVEFHEVGAWDSIADFVGAAYLLEQLGPSSWSVGPLPLGSGRVRTAHGPMPVPAPATAQLLNGFTLIDDGIAGERVTPTGAAILHHLRAVLGEPGHASLRPLALSGSGTGFGTKVLPGISNMLRVLLFEASPGMRADDLVGVIQFEIDDQTAEDLAVGLDNLRATPGVLDVLQLPAFGKKGRIATQVQVLCRRDALSNAVDSCFLETTTLGLRWSVTARTTLDREFRLVESAGQPVKVKLARRPEGQVSMKPDLDDLRGPGGHAGRQQRRREAEIRAWPDDSRQES
jgi:pyridinium-3,5-bisthiocarboxylic acid mononucleotide nickel chelatase